MSREGAAVILHLAYLASSAAGKCLSRRCNLQHSFDYRGKVLCFKVCVTY